MGQVNRYPPGFLDLIGAQQQGKTPPDSSEVLVPTVEMLEFYAAYALSGIRLDATAGAPATFVLSVPDDEAWLLRGVGVRVTLPLATDFEQWSMQLGLLPRFSSAGLATESSARIWTSRLLQNQAAAQDATDGELFDSPVLLVPGTNVTLSLEQRDATAARTTELSVLASVLKTQ